MRQILKLHSCEGLPTPISAKVMVDEEANDFLQENSWPFIDFSTLHGPSRLARFFLARTVLS